MVVPGAFFDKCTQSAQDILSFALVVDSMYVESFQNYSSLETMCKVFLPSLKTSFWKIRFSTLITLAQIGQYVFHFNWLDLDQKVSPHLLTL